jgi:hypothetical protein
MPDRDPTSLFLLGIRQSSWNFVDPGVHTTFTPGRESPITDTYMRRKIRLIESSAKCRHLRKFTCKGTLRQVFICLRPPSLLGYCLGWSSNIVGSESGQIQCVKFLQNMVSTRPHSPPTPSQPVTVSLYFDTGKGGRGGR